MTEAIKPEVGMRVWVDNSSNYRTSGYWGVVVKITPAGMVDVADSTAPSRLRRFKESKWGGYRQYEANHSSHPDVAIYLGDAAQARADAYKRSVRRGELAQRMFSIGLRITPTEDQMDRITALLDQLDAIMKEA